MSVTMKIKYDGFIILLLNRIYGGNIPKGNSFQKNITWKNYDKFISPGNTDTVITLKHQALALLQSKYPKA